MPNIRALGRLRRVVKISNARARIRSHAQRDRNFSVREKQGLEEIGCLRFVNVF